MMEPSMFKRYFSYLILSAILILALSSCSEQVEHLANERSDESANNTYVITNVNVIPMTDDNIIIENVTVLIQDDEIVSFNSAVPEHAVQIDGSGKWLMPGLIDMHVHDLADSNFNPAYPTEGPTAFFDTQDFMLLYVANGVTTVFNLNARPDHFGQRNEIVRGDVIGPRLALAFLIDGSDSDNFATTPSDGRQSVRLAKAQGYEFIKAYTRLDAETYEAIIDEARIQGLKVNAHIPTAFLGRTEDAFVPHLGMVAHAEEYSKQTDTFTPEAAQQFARMTKENGTWVTPNLSNLVNIAEQARTLDGIINSPHLGYVHPLMQNKWTTSNQYNEGTNPERVAYFDELVDFHVLLVKAFKEAGVPMVAGTDAGTSGIIWGFSLHEELELLVEAGLTTEEALVSATHLPATWLEIDQHVGTVEVGKKADLILLDANPLDDITNTQRISGVFVDGEWVSRQKIDNMLLDLEVRNSLNKEDYVWADRRKRD